MKKYIRYSYPLFLFLLSQVVASGLVFFFFLIRCLILNLPYQEIYTSVSSPIGISISLCLSSLLTIIVLYYCKRVNFTSDFSFRGLSLTTVFLGVIATFVGIVATNILSEFLSLPDIIASQLFMMSKNFLGVLAIAVVGPIAEEFVFRGAIMNWMLKQGVKPWKAICFSAFLFGVGHLNPAQIPFAFIVGCMLGYVCYKTKSLWLSIFIHILNNGASVLQLNLLGEDAADFRMIDYLGGNIPAMIVLVVAIIACVCLFMCFKRQSNLLFNDIK